MSSSRNYLKQSGFTLVELMVSIVLGLLVVAGAVQVFIMVKGVFNQAEVVANRQEVMRYFSDVVAGDVRTASQAAVFGDAVIASCDREDGAGGRGLVIDYLPNDSGDYPREDDPYCSSVGYLQRVIYFQNAESGDPFSMCFVCEGGNVVVSNLFEGVEVEFLNTGAVGEIRANLVFVDEIMERAGDDHSKVEIVATVRGEVLRKF